MEQLEQINSALIDTVWRTRAEWNRTTVAKEVANVFNDVLEDMVEMQEFGPNSWGRGKGHNVAM